MLKAVAIAIDQAVVICHDKPAWRGLDDDDVDDQTDRHILNTLFDRLRVRGMPVGYSVSDGRVLELTREQKLDDANFRARKAEYLHRVRVLERIVAEQQQTIDDMEESRSC